MKKRILIFLFVISYFGAIGQTPVHSLHEDFNTMCATSTYPSSGWLIYSIALGAPLACIWQCTATDGRPTITSTPTPGVACTNTYSGTFYLDTSYLLAPKLDISGETGSVYLHYDSKTAYFHLGGRFQIFISTDSIFHVSSPGTEITSFVTPAIGPGDSSGWVSHEVDLTPYKSVPFYVAFRYGADASSGNIWFLDNINTSDSSYTLALPGKQQTVLPIKFAGTGSSSQVNVNFGAIAPGVYNLALIDLPGRDIFKAALNINEGTTSYDITGLNLHPGMYIIKMSGTNSYGAAKVMIR